MSVARNAFGLAPYYQWRTREGIEVGLRATEYICGAAGTAVAVVGGNIQSGAGTTRIMQFTNDGISWSSITSAPNTAIHAMAYGNGVFVGVGAAGVIFSASESAIQTWTARTKAGTSGNDFIGVQYIESTGRFYAWQSSGERLQYSSDGVTWTLAATAFTPDFPINVPNETGSNNAGIAYVNNMHILFTGATASTSSVRFYAFRDISVNSYSGASGGQWCGFPTNAGGDNWYVSTTQSTSVLAFRIGWGAQSALGFPTPATFGVSAGTQGIIPPPEAIAGNSEYFQFGVAEPNAIDIYKTDGYYQVIGSVAYSSARWSNTVWGIGHHMYTDQDFTTLRREFIQSTQGGTLAETRRRFKYRIRFQFKGSQYLIFSKFDPTTNIHIGNRTFVLNGTRAFRPIRTTTDYRY
jgi:hypothetical protein